MRRDAKVQPSQRSATSVVGKARLGNSRGQATGGELLFAPHTGKEPALILLRLEIDNERSRQGCWAKDHRSTLLILYGTVVVVASVGATCGTAARGSHSNRSLRRCFARSSSRTLRRMNDESRNCGLSN